MKKVGIAILVLVIIGGAIGFYLYNKPHRDYQEEEPAYTLNANELAISYAEDQTQANALYLDQVLVVEGVIIEKQEKGLIIEPNIFVTVSDTSFLRKVQEGDEIGIKGRVLGYDELLEEVKIDNATGVSGG